jgi:hypothetical protein
VGGGGDAKQLTTTESNPLLPTCSCLGQGMWCHRPRQRKQRRKHTTTARHHTATRTCRQSDRRCQQLEAREGHKHMPRERGWGLWGWVGSGGSTRKPTMIEITAPMAIVVKLNQSTAARIMYLSRLSTSLVNLRNGTQSHPHVKHDAQPPTPCPQLSHS